MGRFEIRPDGLFLDDAPFVLATGDLHYFRIHPEQWRQRLDLMKQFGLTAVQTYVPWNAHEPREGQFDFTGIFDLGRFLKLAAQAGLAVLLRPSPYICSEWDFGGLPWWLLKKPGLKLRCSHPDYLESVRRYYARLCQEIVPALSTHGGPIIAVAIENEYGSYGTDASYLQTLQDMLTDFGVDVPFYTTDGYADYHLTNGMMPGNWAGVNYRIESKQAIEKLKLRQPELPPYVGEYWSGRSCHWGETFFHRDAEPIALAYREALDLGASVNFYMFGGGTNFGFMNGANYGVSFQPKPDEKPHYNPLVTSYDVDALVGEDGRPREKYLRCHQELAAWHQEHVPNSNMVPMGNLPRQQPAQAIGTVSLKADARLFDQLNRLSQPIRSPWPMSMEECDQGYGFILYQTAIRGPAGLRDLRLPDLHDRAMVFVDHVYQGTIMRDDAAPSIRIDCSKPETTLQILVENMGRICFGSKLEDRKGLLGGVLLGGSFLHDWAQYPLPLDNLDQVMYTPIEKHRSEAGYPTFYRTIFSALPGVDTFIELPGWGKGNVWINGFNLGRYWSAGPQQTLYVPGPLLQENNTCDIFELHAANEDASIRFIDHARLTTEA